MSKGNLNLFFITNNLDVALIAEKYGVDRIWIDLETIGKEIRQQGMNTVKSRHTVEDIYRIKPYLTKAQMLVRVNPWYVGSEKEIEEVIKAGADIIMLPYWKSADEVKNFIKAVNGRCNTSLLLENKEAVECIDDVLDIGGFDEIHIGLNDLHLSYGLTFMFELLANGTVERLCEKFSAVGVPYGFGGIARLGAGILPAERVVMEHYRLGSTRAILSRAFCDTTKLTDIDEIDVTFKYNMKALRDFEEEVHRMSPKELEQNKSEVKNVVKTIVDKMRSRDF